MRLNLKGLETIAAWSGLFGSIALVAAIALS